MGQFFFLTWRVEKHLSLFYLQVSSFFSDFQGTSTFIPVLWGRKKALAPNREVTSVGSKYIVPAGITSKLRCMTRHPVPWTNNQLLCLMASSEFELAKAKRFLEYDGVFEFQDSKIGNRIVNFQSRGFPYGTTLALELTEQVLFDSVSSPILSFSLR